MAYLLLIMEPRGQRKEQAIAIASECPVAEWATVEMRAIAACYES